MSVCKGKKKKKKRSRTVALICMGCFTFLKTTFVSNILFYYHDNFEAVFIIPLLEIKIIEVM